MQAFLDGLNNVFIWGINIFFGNVMLLIFLGIGLLCTILTRGVQFRKFGVAFRAVFSGIKARSTNANGELKPFQALATALSSCVGTGKNKNSRILNYRHLFGPEMAGSFECYRLSD